MRLAVKIFLANSLVILVLLAVAVWSVIAVNRLSVADRTFTVRAAEALRLEVGLRETMVKAHRLEMRRVVFGDPEYAAVSSAAAAQIAGDLQRLEALLTTDEERERLGDAARGFDAYRAVVARAGEIKGRASARGAEALLTAEAQPLVDRIVSDLDRLILLTQEALDQTQQEAKAALGHARIQLHRLQLRTWTVVQVALALALLIALGSAATIAFRMTRSLRRLSEATRAVAEGQFREPLLVETRDEIGDLARSFNSMAARLREVDELKERFYATVSHELRSPLMSIREAAHLMNEQSPGPLTEKQERLVAIVRKGSDRLIRLVNEVLDVSRLGAGLLPLDRRWLDLERAVRRAVDELRAYADQRGLSLHVERRPGPTKLFGDEDRIVQIVVNLVANALRFTPSGGTVTVRIGGTETEAVLEVEDTGIGISPDQLPLVFDRFRQAHGGRGGTGLGLAIVRSMVEAHRGQVTVESREGKGTRFTVSLPREAPPDVPHAGKPR